jgi:hypothetical protein
MNRAPHQGDANQQAILQARRHRLRVEIRDAAPQSDERRRRILHLQADEMITHLGHDQRRTLQQMLAGEQDPVQYPVGQLHDSVTVRRFGQRSVTTTLPVAVRLSSEATASAARSSGYSTGSGGAILPEASSGATSSHCSVR